MKNENEIIKMLKNEFDEVIVNYRGFFHKEIKKLVAEIFLYNNYHILTANEINGKIVDIETYIPDLEAEKEKDYQPPFNIVDTERYFSKNQFITVGSLLSNITGEPHWINGVGFENYDVEAQGFYLELVLKKLESQLIQKNISDKPAKFLDNLLTNEAFVEHIWDVINKELNKIKEIKVLDVIDEVLDEVIQSRMKTTIERDIEVLKLEREKKIFKKLEEEVLDLFGYNERLGYLNSKKLTKNHKVELELLQFWAKSKTFQDLKIFNNYYSFADNLSNFKWLNNDIYKEKLSNYLKTKESMRSLFGDNNKELAPFHLRQTYSLLEKIMNIKRDKFVYLVIKGERPKSFRVFIDKYGRVGSSFRDFFILIDCIEEAILNGYIFIKLESEETYQKTFGKKEVTHNYNYIYGIFMNDLQYDGMNSQEVEELYNQGLSFQKGFFTLEETDKFKDFDI